jgi:ribose transport system ATP-binding protein
MIAVELSGIAKSYGSQKVLYDISLSIEAGSAVSLIGENGAGKSSLAKIIAGITSPDEGSLSLFGETTTFSHPREAIAAGVGIVHQEISLLDNLTIAENISLGREPLHRGCLDRQRMNEIAQSALSQLASTLPPTRKVSTLSVAQKQLVEIARALAHQARILIFDEPTSSLSEHDTEHLLQTIETLRLRGVTIIYVSHRLAEVMRISDRVIALRDGRLSGELTRPQITRDALITSMIGRELRDMYSYTPRQFGDVVLELSNFQASADHTPFSLTVRAGEIVGIAGLIGAGRSELIEALYGVRTASSGSVSVRGKQLPSGLPPESLRSGLALVPESRKEQGIIAPFSISDLIALVSGADGDSSIVRSLPRESAQATQWIAELGINCTGPAQPVGNLSGGNQQKVGLAKCLASQPAVLLLDEPTRGIDIGARKAIYELLFALASRGLAILFVSSELDEVMGLADRVLVMNDGTIAGTLLRGEYSERAIISLASHHESAVAYRECVG